MISSQHFLSPDVEITPPYFIFISYLMHYQPIAKFQLKRWTKCLQIILVFSHIIVSTTRYGSRTRNSDSYSGIFGAIAKTGMKTLFKLFLMRRVKICHAVTKMGKYFPLSAEQDKQFANCLLNGIFVINSRKFSHLLDQRYWSKLILL